MTHHFIEYATEHGKGLVDCQYITAIHPTRTGSEVQLTNGIYLSSITPAGALIDCWMANPEFAFPKEEA